MTATSATVGTKWFDVMTRSILPFGIEDPIRGETMCARETSFSMGSLADLTIADKR